MNLNRPLLKLRAQQIMGTSRPRPTTVGIIYLLLSVFVSMLSVKLVGINLSQSEIEQYMQYVADGNLDYALEFIDTIDTPSVGSYIVDALLQIAMWVVSTGFIMFLMNTVRNTGACYGNLLDGFGMFGRILLLNILEGIFIGLWSMLFVVPGIVAAYRYRMAIYLLIDHPEMSPMQCIRESKRMMQGRKGELFMLDLSFIGWQILASAPVLGWLVQIWSLPYINVTRVLYYEYVCGKPVFAVPPFGQPGQPGPGQQGGGDQWQNRPPWEG